MPPVIPTAIFAAERPAFTQKPVHVTLRAMLTHSAELRCSEWLIALNSLRNERKNSNMHLYMQEKKPKCGKKVTKKSSSSHHVSSHLAF